MDGRETLENLIGATFVFGLRSEREAERALTLLGLDPDDRALRDRLLGFDAGRCLMRDHRGASRPCRSRSWFRGCSRLSRRHPGRDEARAALVARRRSRPAVGGRVSGHGWGERRAGAVDASPLAANGFESPSCTSPALAAQLSTQERTNCSVSGVAVAPVPLSNYSVDVDIPSGLSASFHEDIDSVVEDLFITRSGPPWCGSITSR